MKAIEKANLRSELLVIQVQVFEGLGVAAGFTLAHRCGQAPPNVSRLSSSPAGSHTKNLTPARTSLFTCKLLATNPRRTSLGVDFDCYQASIFAIHLRRRRGTPF